MHPFDFPAVIVVLSEREKATLNLQLAVVSEVHDVLSQPDRLVLIETEKENIPIFALWIVMLDEPLGCPFETNKYKSATSCVKPSVHVETDMPFETTKNLDLSSVEGERQRIPLSDSHSDCSEDVQNILKYGETTYNPKDDPSTVKKAEPVAAALINLKALVCIIPIENKEVEEKTRDPTLTCARWLVKTR